MLKSACFFSCMYCVLMWSTCIQIACVYRQAITVTAKIPSEGTIVCTSWMYSTYKRSTCMKRNVPSKWVFTVNKIKFTVTSIHGWRKLKPQYLSMMVIFDDQKCCKTNFNLPLLPFCKKSLHFMYIMFIWSKRETSRLIKKSLRNMIQWFYKFKIALWRVK